MSIKSLQANKSSGFTLLEVMIAMVIFSIGMLGLAGIQGIAVNNNYTSYMSTIAMQQAYNMTDIIRSSANDKGEIHSAFDTVSTSVGSAPSKNCIADNQSTVCTTAELANFDIYQWQKRMENDMPSGRGKITRTGDIYEIIIMWDESRTGVSGEACSGNSAVDLKCYTLHIQV